MYGNKIFISYSSYKIGEAKVVREFFNNNDFEVIMVKMKKRALSILWIELMNVSMLLWF